MLVTLAAACCCAALLAPRAHASEASVKRIICVVFGAHCSEALTVARCESHFSIWATNGQYHGLFQMGSAERQRFGDGWNAWAQARAAHRYFLLAGWRPWACSPW